MTYEQDFPPGEGPPPIANYSGRSLFNSTKRTYTVTLDEGTFRALWELVESETKHRYPVRETMRHVQALARGVAVFRKTYWAENEKPVAKKPTGRIVPTKKQRAEAMEAATRARAKVRRVRAASSQPASPARPVRRIRPR